MDKKLQSTNPRSFNRRKIRCFVAMAFGKSDTDLVYDKYIARAIEEAGMIPVRVDKLIHNERIDFKIRESIAEADLVVADLTYARPSVYWEAGYAERKVPVVYTCRSDHFQPQSDDINGNLQVHFDLRNANIIAWKGGGSKQFKENLRKRLLYVSIDLREEIEKESELRLEREKFLAISSEMRCKLVSLVTPSLLEKYGFRLLGEIYSGYGYSDFSFDSKEGGQSFLVYWKKTKNIALLVMCLYCGKELNKSALKNLKRYAVEKFATRYHARWEDFPPKMTSRSKNEIRVIRRLVLIPALGKVPISRIDSVFPAWHRSGDRLHYYNPEIESLGSQFLSTSSELLLIDDIKSISDYENYLSKAIMAVESDQMPIVVPSKRRNR